MKTKNQRLLATALLLAILSILDLQLSTAHAASGDLDSTFGGTGESRVGFGRGEQNRCVASVQTDGKLVLAGRGITAGGCPNLR